MFSFFKTKKSSPSSSPESDPIPSANDFVIVDQRHDNNPNVNPNPNPNPPYPLYPNFGQFFHPGAMPPMPPIRQPLQHSDSVQHYNYVHDIPFKLSSQLSTGDSEEITKIQVEDILASITAKMEISQAEYDFSLERSILQEPDADTTDSAAADEVEEEAE